MANSNVMGSLHEYDHGDWMEDSWFYKALTKTNWGCGLGKLVRIESMDITNDPRFFAGNVMDKRLGALKSLTLVSSIMFGTAMKQCFVLKKDMNFEEVDPLVGNIGMWQITAFFLALMVSIQCLLSLYVVVQQLFYCYRLMTAGSLGFDLAAIFYLTKTITMWRHLAIKMLYNGMLKFLILVGVQLFVSFYQDAKAVKDVHENAMVVNMINMTSVEDYENLEHFVAPKPQHVLNMKVHAGLGYLTLGICTIGAFVMWRIRTQHAAVFAENYKHCEHFTFGIERAVDTMGTRAGPLVET